MKKFIEVQTIAKLSKSTQESTFGGFSEKELNVLEEQQCINVDTAYAVLWAGLNDEAGTDTAEYKGRCRVVEGTGQRFYADSIMDLFEKDGKEYILGADYEKAFPNNE